MSKETNSVKCTHGKGFNCRICYPAQKKAAVAAIAPTAMPALVSPTSLRKKQPPKDETDINTVVPWDQVAWQPNKVPA